MGTDVELRGGADFSETERKIEKLGQAWERQEKRIRQLTGENAKLERQVQKSGQAQEQAFGGAALGRLASYAAGVFSIVAVVNQLREAYRMANEESKKTAIAGRTAVETLQTTVAGAGDIGQFGRVESALASMGGGAALMTMPERTGVYGAVRGSMPTAPLGSVLGITREAMKGRLVYGDAGSTARLGSVMGDLARVMPGKSPGDLGDVAQLLVSAAGKQGQTLGREAWKGVEQLMAAGVPAESAIGMLLASYEAKQGPEALSSYASALTQKKRGRGGRVSPAAEAMRAEFERGGYAESAGAAMRGDALDVAVAAAGRPELIQAARASRAGEVAETLAEYQAAPAEMEYRGWRAQQMADLRRAGLGPWGRERVAGPAMDIGHRVAHPGGLFTQGVQAPGNMQALLEDAVARGTERGNRGPIMSPPNESRVGD